MFNSITGTITYKGPKQLFLANNGIEWDIFVPDSNLEKLPSIGNECKIWTFLQHTDQAMQLFGFSSQDERTLFFDLLKVEGIGAKGAIKIMSSVSSERLIKVLDSGDVDSLEKIPGVGKKTAAKMLLALKGKLSLKDNDATVIRLEKNLPFNDVILSLVSMGYDKKMAEQKVAFIYENLKQNDEFVSKSQKEKEEIIFKKALIELA